MDLQRSQPSWEVRQAIRDIVESVSSSLGIFSLSRAYASQLQRENVVVIKFVMSTAALSMMSYVEYPSSISLRELAQTMMISESVAGIFRFRIP